ncbi:MAG: hypothetical protein KY455_11035 [Euryarchaeota archaeon]|nr:hypothetical protein [Euryarchaeota archaeon]
MWRPTVIFLALLAVSFSGCIGDETASDGSTSEWTEPVFEDLKTLPETITDIGLLGASDTPSGSGIWVDGDHAYVGGRATGFHVVDISDPAEPVVVGHLNGTGEDKESGVYARDVDLITYADGTKVAVLAGQSLGMYFVDVTVPTDPVLLATIATPQMPYTYEGEAREMPTHNVAAVPGTTLVYNSPSGGLGRTNHIIDASVPDEPKVIGNWGEHGCHDTTFYVSEEENRSRAYCAGRDVTEIWDIADPTAPVLLTSLNHPVVDNGGGLHHLAMVDQTASILIIGDEFRGGSGPGCQADTSAGSTPLGALWFFDIKGDNEKAPKELGSFSPTLPLERTLAANGDYHERLLANPTGAPQPTTSCTAHFGEFIGDKPVLAMGWYLAGVVLIDLSDPTDPKQIAQFNDGTDTWDVKFHRGVLVTGDMARGLDVLELL